MENFLKKKMKRWKKTSTMLLRNLNFKTLEKKLKENWLMRKLKMKKTLMILMKTSMSLKMILMKI